jgi:cyclohexadieny/prephenate dehydrogenase
LGISGGLKGKGNPNNRLCLAAQDFFSFSRNGFSRIGTASIKQIVLQQLTILAPGLLGASLGLAARHFSIAQRVHVWARRPESRQQCEEAAWCDAAFADPAEASKGSELVVVCTPVDRIAEMVRHISPVLQDQAIVTDVGSTKSRICRSCAHVVPRGVSFIGAHPMAGSEKSGLSHARADLFQGRACLVTPLENSDPEAVDRTVRFWRELGMEVTTVSPEKHDEIVAHISHLPHLLASVLCLQLGKKPALWQAFSGNGLKDTTRIAAGSPEIWRSIFEENREELLRALDGFEREVATLRSHLHNEEWAQVRHLLRLGKAYREELD